MRIHDMGRGEMRLSKVKLDEMEIDEMRQYEIK